VYDAPATGAAPFARHRRRRFLPGVSIEQCDRRRKILGLADVRIANGVGIGEVYLATPVRVGVCADRPLDVLGELRKLNGLFVGDVRRGAADGHVDVLGRRLVQIHLVAPRGDEARVRIPHDGEPEHVVVFEQLSLGRVVQVGERRKGRIGPSVHEHPALRLPAHVRVHHERRRRVQIAQHHLHDGARRLRHLEIDDAVSQVCEGPVREAFFNCSGSETRTCIQYARYGIPKTHATPPPCTTPTAELALQADSSQE